MATISRYQFSHLFIATYLTLVVIVVQISLSASVVPRPSTYKAAVFSLPYVAFKPSEPIRTRAAALKQMTEVLDVYSRQAKLASDQNADIIVFPEAGLYLDIEKTRKNAYHFTEEIPNPKQISWNPCKDHARFSGTEVQIALSCMASNNSIYVVANMVDSKRCTSPSNCPTKDQGIYNTNVAFSPEGKLLAKYHKTHLFFEPAFTSGDGEVVYFDTHFGRVGLAICFDILHKTPTVDMVMEHNVTDIAFPAAWVDVPPFVTSIGFHSSVARGLGVNVLAANLQFVSRRAYGSGIYTPEGQYGYYYNTQQHTGKLVIGTINIINKKVKQLNQISEDGSKPTSLDIVSNKNGDEFTSRIFQDLYTLRKLEGDSGSLNVCQKNVCCSLEYEKVEKQILNSPSEMFALGAFDGLHTYIEQAYLQVCTVLRCKVNGTTSCETRDQAKTVFKSLVLTGNFQTQYVYPQVIVTDNNELKLAGKNTWDFKESKLTVKPGDLARPLISASLLARDYSRDKSGDSGNTNRGDSITCYTLYNITLLLIIMRSIICF